MNFTEKVISFKRWLAQDTPGPSRLAPGMLGLPVFFFDALISIWGFCVPLGHVYKIKTNKEILRAPASFWTFGNIRRTPSVAPSWEFAVWMSLWSRPSPPVEKICAMVRPVPGSLCAFSVLRFLGLYVTGVCRSVVTLELVLGVNYPYPQAHTLLPGRFGPRYYFMKTDQNLILTFIM